MHRWLTILACLAFASPASAIVRRHDVADSNYVSQGSAYHQVVWLVGTDGRYGTGTLIAPDWILTAGHFGADPSYLHFIDVNSGPTSAGPSLGTVINVASPYTGDVAAGNDIKLLQLSAPVATLPGTSTPLLPLNRHSGTVGSLVGQVVQRVGYGDAGNGVDGITGSPGTKRMGTNVIDGQGTLLNPPNPAVYTGGPYSSNFVVADFDGVGAANRWGSATPQSLEGGVSPGDSGGPWIFNSTVAAVSSFAGSNNSPYPAFGYRDASVATAVSPFNDWINSVMGGVNWNTRAQSFFDNPAAWGDGRVPGGKDVQFSFPAISGSRPVIAFDEPNTAVRNLQVEFGPHEFALDGNNLITSGAINVDDGGTMIFDGGVGGTLKALPITGMRVGRHTAGKFVQNGGTVDVDQDMYVGTNAGSDGEYELNGGNLQVQGTLSVGYAGTGEFIHDGGEVDAVTVFIGELEGSTGYYALNSSSEVDIHTLEVGRAGTGHFEQHDGDVYVSASHIRIGRAATGNGTYEIDGGRLRSQAGFSIYVGFDGVGTFIQSGGVVEGGSSLQLGVASGSNGSYLATDGTATFASRITVGAIGEGRMEVSNNGSVAGPELMLARDSAAIGTVAQSGGSVNIAGDVFLTSASGATANYDLSDGELFVGAAINFGPGTGIFNFTGGTLHVGTFNGPLNNQGGTLAPGNSAGVTTINGGYTQANMATLEIEIGGTIPGSEYDQLVVAGDLSLDGALAVSLIDSFNPVVGQAFNIMDWGSLAGVFSSITLPTLAGMAWDTSQLYIAGMLNVVAATLPGDFNNDGTVDAADYVVWRKGFGTTYTQDHYNDWRVNFGRTAGSGGIGHLASEAAVPEPSAGLLLCGASLVFLLRRSS